MRAQGFQEPYWGALGGLGGEGGEAVEALSLYFQPPGCPSIKKRISRSCCENQLKLFQILSGDISPVFCPRRDLAPSLASSHCPFAQAVLSRPQSLRSMPGQQGFDGTAILPLGGRLSASRGVACKGPIGFCFLLCALRSQVPQTLFSVHREPCPQAFEAWKTGS